MIRLFSYSLSVRLLAIFLLLGALFAWSAVLGMRWIYSADDLRTLISSHLELHIDYVRRDIGNPPRIDRALEITRRVPVDIHIAGPSTLWASDPGFPPPTTLDFGPSRYFSNSPDAWFNELQGVEFAIRDGHRYFRFSEGPYQIVVVTPKIAQTSSRPPLLPIIVGIGLLLVLAAYLAVRWLFRPVGEIRRGAARIGQGDFSHRITTRRRDELGELAGDINLMAGEVQQMLDAKRQLLLGISHELRSPLSRLRLGLEFADDPAQREALVADLTEMNQIIETLLEAERLGSTHAPLQLRPVRLSSLLQELLDRYFDRERQRIRVTQSGDVDLVSLDGPRITLMLKNLVGNALRYSRPEDGPVELSVVTEGDQVRFQVRDYGPGISPAQVERLGEPFFRSDPSRTRGTGGTGLGLYLARQVARAHGGDLRVRSEVSPGACLVASMPLRPIAPDQSPADSVGQAERR